MKFALPVAIGQRFGMLAEDKLQELEKAVAALKAARP